MFVPNDFSLQKEILETVPFASKRQEAVLALVRTTDVVVRGISRLIEPYGVTHQQYNVLRILRGAGASGLPTLEISGRMVEQAPGITRMVDRLEAKELVSRERGCDDRRHVVCRITEKGSELLARMDAPVTEAGSAALSMLDNSEVDQLIKLLESIRRGHEQRSIS